MIRVPPSLSAGRRFAVIDVQIQTLAEGAYALILSIICLLKFELSLIGWLDDATRWDLVVGKTTFLMMVGLDP